MISVSANTNTLVVGLDTFHDGNYWVVRSAELGLVAAHQQMRMAWMRATRMVVGQLTYALNNDPTLSGLLSGEGADAIVRQMGELKNRGSFGVKIKTEYQPTEHASSSQPTEKRSLSFDVPELTNC